MKPFVSEPTRDDAAAARRRREFEDVLRQYAAVTATKLRPGLTVCGVEIDPVTGEARRRCWSVSDSSPR